MEMDEDGKAVARSLAGDSEAFVALASPLHGFPAAEVRQDAKVAFP